MNKVLKLLKINVLGMFGLNKAIHGKGTNHRMRFFLFSLIALLIAAAALTVSAFYNFIFSQIFIAIGKPELIIGLMATLSCIMTFFTTINKCNGFLFGFKDYDMVMSLPVTSNQVLSSRLMMLYLSEVMFSIVLLLPAMVIYAIYVPVSTLYYVLFIIGILLLPLIPIILATFVGAIITFIASRFKRTNIISTVIGILFACGIMVFSFTLGSSFGSSVESMAQLNQLGESFGNFIYAYPPTKLFINGACFTDTLSFIVFAVISISAFALFVILISLSYNSINTALMSKKVKSNYKLREMHTASPFKALYKKELRRYFSSSIYVMNTAFGMVLLLILSVAVLAFGADKVTQLLSMPTVGELFKGASPLIVSLFVTMSSTTACSISLEGKNLWILKSSPIRVRDVFRAKIAVNLLVCIPASLISSTLLAIALKTNIIDTILLFITPVIFSFFVSYFGLIINLCFPKLDWKSEINAVKQSGSTFVAVFAGMIIGMVPMFLALFLGKPRTVVVITIFFFTLITILLAILSNTAGKKLFRKL